jgi:hypothetical protein
MVGEADYALHDARTTEIPIIGSTVRKNELFGHETDNFLGKRVDDTIVHFDAFTLAFDNPLVLEQCKVLGNRCLGKPKTFPNMFYIAFLGAESGNYFQTYRMTENFADFRLVVETSVFIEFHGWLHILDINIYILLIRFVNLLILHRQLRDSMSFINPVSQNFDNISVFKQINHYFMRELYPNLYFLTMGKYTIIEVIIFWNSGKQSLLELRQMRNNEKKHYSVNQSQTS